MFRVYNGLTRSNKTPNKNNHTRRINTMTIVYKIDDYEWYIGYNNKEWFANGIERNFYAKTKEELITKIDKWYTDMLTD